MKRMITYGACDLLHYGCISSLLRISELDEHLVVVIPAGEFGWGQKRTNAHKYHIGATALAVDQKGKPDLPKDDCLGITYPLRMSRTFTIQIACGFKK